MVTIRTMTIEDISEVINLWTRSGIELTLSDRPEELLRMLDQNKDLCLVGINEKVDEKSIISAVLGGFDGRRGWVHHLAVDPFYQKKNIGKLMMDEIMNRFQQKNVVKVKLEILKTNIGVLTFYKKLNWDLRDDLVTMSFTLRK